MASHTEGSHLTLWAFVDLVLAVCVVSALLVAASIVALVVHSLIILIKSKTWRRIKNGNGDECASLLATQRDGSREKCRPILATHRDGTKVKGDCMPLLEAKAGKISHYELWFLAGKMTESGTGMNKLRDTFQELKITADIKEGQREAYRALCKWKQENREVDQAKELEEVLMNFHFDDVWTKMMDEKTNTKRKVSQKTMEHIIWSIDDIEKVNQFLSQLIPDQEPINANEKMVCVVEEAVRSLNAWNNESCGLNPVVLMSLALENAGCSSIERLLFSVLEELMAPIQDEKLREFTDKLTGRHCKRLAMALKPNEQNIDDYISKNRHYVFDTRSLITKWLDEVECSNYEKRRKLDDAVIKIGRYDLQDFFMTLGDRPNAEQAHVKSYYFDHTSIFDDDIPQLVKLVKWLPLDKKRQLKKNIGLPDEKDDDDETLKDQMKAWRNSITTTSSNKLSRDQALKEFQSFRKELTNKTKYTELTLTDEEIEAISSHVTSTGKEQELTSRLHIGAVHGQIQSFVGQLKQWRNTQAKRNCRETLQKALKQIGLAESIVRKSTTKQLDREELTCIALNLMMEDVRPIIDALGIDQENVKSFVRQWNNIHNCTTGLLLKLKKESRSREGFCKALRKVGFIDIARSVYFGENV